MHLSSAFNQGRFNRSAFMLARSAQTAIVGGLLVKEEK
jgi:hypothetical protein